MWVFTLDMVKKSKITGKERQECGFAAIYEGWTRRVNVARGAEKCTVRGLVRQGGWWTEQRSAARL